MMMVVVHTVGGDETGGVGGGSVSPCLVVDDSINSLWACPFLAWSHIFPHFSWWGLSGLFIFSTVLSLAPWGYLMLALSRLAVTSLTA